jgi:hypothetical protein
MTNQMAMITNVLPIVFVRLLAAVPPAWCSISGSNLWRLGQQELILRKITKTGDGGTCGDRQRDRRRRANRWRATALGGLRKLFQLPAANGDATNATAWQRRRVGGHGAKPKGSGTGATGKGQRRRQARGSGAAQQSSSGSSSRRTNKKRKRR